MINYEEEHKKILDYEGDNYFKPEAGEYVIVFCSEAETKDYLEEDGTVIRQVMFTIQVNKVTYLWTIPRGKTDVSLWGQLLDSIADRKPHNFNGHVVKLRVKGEGLKKRYKVLRHGDI